MDFQCIQKQEEDKKLKENKWKIAICKTIAFRERIERKKSAMLQFHLVYIPKEYATRIDYHCGLNQPKQIRRQDWLLVRSLFARR